MDGVRFETGRGGGKERTGGKQKPDFLSGLERPSRADAERCPLTAAKNSSPPPLMEKASTERQQEDGGEKRKRKTKTKCVSAAPEHNFLRLCSFFCLSLCCPAVRRYPQRDAACRGLWGMRMAGGVGFLGGLTKITTHKHTTNTFGCVCDATRFTSD